MGHPRTRDRLMTRRPALRSDWPDKIVRVVQNARNLFIGRPIGRDRGPTMNKTTALFALLLPTAAFLACGRHTEGTCEETATCALADGGPDGVSDGTVTPPGCDLTKPVKDSPSCVDDGVGIFVSPSGNDGSDGRRSSPVASIGKGLELTRSRGLSRVYVCDGTYAQRVEISAAVTIIGGLSCSWAAADVKPKIAPTAGVAVSVKAATGAVVLEDLEVVGAAEPTPGSSAVAIFVSESASVTVRRTNVRALDAVNGAEGGIGSNYTAAAKDGVGQPAGAAAVVCSCLDGVTSSTGGAGGAVGAGGGVGSAVPPVGADNAGLGGASCTVGTAGTNGLGGNGGAGSVSAMSLTASGISSITDAKSGDHGNPGQGGGGGGGRTGLIGGGGGACGGCGGGGGKPGANGGSSIAIASFRSTISVDASVLSAGRGGAGGRGGPGQDGQSGGAPGAGVCDGGSGGAGAGGSGGGGGSGGHSIAIAYVGPTPTMIASSVTASVPGAVGGGGAAGAGTGAPGAVGLPGSTGLSRDTLELQ